MRFLAYFLLPVPLAVLGLVVGTMVSRRAALSLDDAVEVTGVLLVAGHVIMGIPSALFAMAMLRLERQQVARRTRSGLACVLGAVLGAPVALLWQWPIPAISIALFGSLGAAVGGAVTMLVDAPAAVPTAARRLHARALVALLIPCAVATLGRNLADQWVDRARAGVLASIAVGMTYDEVVHEAGAPTHENWVEASAPPTESVDVMQYNREDPASSYGWLQVTISFKNERVVQIRRELLTRD